MFSFGIFALMTDGFVPLWRKTKFTTEDEETSMENVENDIGNTTGFAQG